MGRGPNTLTLVSLDSSVPRVRVDIEAPWGPDRASRAESKGLLQKDSNLAIWSEISAGETCLLLDQKRLKGVWGHS